MPGFEGKRIEIPGLDLNEVKSMASKLGDSIMLY